LFGCEVGIRFPVVKLNDYAPHLDQLLEHPNVFALVTAAHLLTQQTKAQDVKRHAAKWWLARNLYEREWDKQRIIDLFNIIDWIMQIPAPLQSQLMHDISQLERNRNMPYISSFERKGREEGLREGRLEGKLEGRLEGKLEGRLEGRQEALRELLTGRFGALPQVAEDRVAKATLSELKAWTKAVMNAPTLESVFGQH
jgi:flagellar biosynthesis/type III secretory pathway protein FliH